VLPSLDEYDSLALIRAIHTEPLQKPKTPELYRHHFRLLCDAIAQWMAGVISPQGMPSWEDFSLGVRRVLEQVRRDHADQNVLLVSSGGPISTAVGEVLGTAPEVTIALNMRIRNSAVTEFSVLVLLCHKRSRALMAAQCGQCPRAPASATLN
jgi:broad specificity phosphatase PhoE